jgi:hypothetical protein
MSYRSRPVRHLFALGLLGAIATCGCHTSSNVAPVSGTVTLDGAPLERASVMFLPVAGGRPSYGVTNAQGRYVLEYSATELGAEVGKCTVTISTASEGDDGSPAVKERVPKHYKDSPMEVEVDRKDNTINIELKSQP